MVNIKLSVGAFEDWLRNEMGHEFVEKDLARKHEKMAQSPFRRAARSNPHISLR